MILIIILIIIFFILAYYLSTQGTNNNNVAIQSYIRQIDPTLDLKSPFIVCILRYGLGNRMNCLSSSLILSRYLKVPLYVVWTDIDMGPVRLSDIWAPPYPFTILDAIPSGIGPWGLSHTYQYKLFDDEHIRQLNDNDSSAFSNGVTDLKISTPVMVLGTYWNFKHPEQSLEDFYGERSKIFTKDLVPVQPIVERIQYYRSLCGLNTFGVHIRLTDSCVVQWGSQKQCDALAITIKRHIGTLLDEDDHERTVFLCTDDQTYITDLIVKYNDRIIIPNSDASRFSIEGQQEAYAEIMVLSDCSPLLLSLRSTFSSNVASIAPTNECIFYSPNGEYRCKSVEY